MKWVAHLSEEMHVEGVDRLKILIHQCDRWWKNCQPRRNRHTICGCSGVQARFDSGPVMARQMSPRRRNC